MRHLPDRHAGPEVRPFGSDRAFAAFMAARTPRPVGENDSSAKVLFSWLETPLGVMIVAASDGAVHLLEFAERRALARQIAILQARFALGIGRTRRTGQIAAELTRYFRKDLRKFATPLAPEGSEFSQSVWRQIGNIDYGKSITYGQLAERSGRQAAVRAVARANGANPIAIAIPCHRVRAANGALTGYGGGVWRKRELLALETPNP